MEIQKILSEGMPAPDFKLQNQNDATIHLKDFKNSWIVLYFYPKDNTPGCTTEAIDFTHLKHEFEACHATILGVSKDSVASHQKFCMQQNLTIQLLSDPDQKMIESYGVWQEKTSFGKTSMGIVRSTFIIDPEGIIRKALYNVKAKDHAASVLDQLKSLQKK